jgi:hypothetical protein
MMTFWWPWFAPIVRFGSKPTVRFRSKFASWYQHHKHKADSPLTQMTPVPIPLMSWKRFFDRRWQLFDGTAVILANFRLWIKIRVISPNIRNTKPTVPWPKWHPSRCLWCPGSERNASRDDLNGHRPISKRSNFFKDKVMKSGTFRFSVSVWRRSWGLPSKENLKENGSRSRWNVQCENGNRNRENAQIWC